MLFVIASAVFIMVNVVFIRLVFVVFIVASFLLYLFCCVYLVFLIEYCNLLVVVTLQFRKYIM